MSVYDDQAQRMRDKIHQLNLLKNAQEDDSRHYHRYQDQITALTSALLDLEETAPRLVEIDREITLAKSRLNSAHRRVTASGQLPSRAASFGVPGVLLLFLGVHTGWMPLTGLALALIAAAAGVLILMSRRRQTDDEAVGVASRRVAELEATRQDLLPYDIDTIMSNALETV